VSGPSAAPGAIPAPFDVYRDRVRPEWIDNNHHMNMGYYVVVFDLATTRGSLGWGWTRRTAARSV
jgi:acyl-CoA thioesterase FadM